MPPVKKQKTLADASYAGRVEVGAVSVKTEHGIKQEVLLKREDGVKCEVGSNPLSTPLKVEISQKLFARWRKAFPWLIRSNCGRKVGCAACQWANSKTQCAKVDAFPKFSSLTRHESLEFHQANFKRWNLRPRDSLRGPLSNNVVPPAAAFKQVWYDVRSGKAVLRHRRTARIAYCLAESMKAYHQGLVAKAKSATLYRDESKSRLSCRRRIFTKQ